MQGRRTLTSVHPLHSMLFQACARHIQSETALGMMQSIKTSVSYSVS